MRLERIDKYYVVVQGFDHVKNLEAKNLLHELRSKFPDMSVQLVKGSMIGGYEHLIFAVRNAIAVHNGPRRKSKSLAMEILLYVSCQRQISQAISLVGVSPQDVNIALVAIGDSKEILERLVSYVSSSSVLHGEPNDQVIEITSQKKLSELEKAYGITEKELVAGNILGEDKVDALKRLLVERTALVAVEG